MALSKNSRSVAGRSDVVTVGKLTKEHEFLFWQTPFRRHRKPKTNFEEIEGDNEESASACDDDLENGDSFDEDDKYNDKESELINCVTKPTNSEITKRKWLKKLNPPKARKMKGDSNVREELFTNISKIMNQRLERIPTSN